MDRTMVSVPKQTAEVVKELSNKIRKETGIYEPCGTIIAKAVSEYVKKVGK